MRQSKETTLTLTPVITLSLTLSQSVPEVLIDWVLIKRCIPTWGLTKSLSALTA